MPVMTKPKFLTAKWTNLLMVNYEVPPEVLQPYLPPATELDLWEGKCLVSMVGFLFQDTRVFGVKWPLHVNFEEVNLRFYVRHFDGMVWKRGAVFISEIVPKHIISLMANTIYNEHYSAMPMRHSITELSNGLTDYTYEWKSKGKWNRLGAIVHCDAAPMQSGSAEEFIFEHYWGYNALTENKTLEYAVEHISWKVREVRDVTFEADVAKLYGEQFVPYLSATPYSAFFADGSAVAVRVAGKITATSSQITPL